MKIWKLNKNEQEIEQLYISTDNLLQNNGKTSQNNTVCFHLLICAYNKINWKTSVKLG